MSIIKYLNWLSLQEREFSKRLSEFLPKGLTVRSYTGYYFIGEAGFLGLLEDDVADFDGDRKIVIHDPEWAEAIKSAVGKYEAKYGTTIQIFIDSNQKI